MNNHLRRRILEVSQQVTACHVAPAFSCVDILAAVYASKRAEDTVILSKGHGALALYAVLEAHGELPRSYLDNFCRTGGAGAHPSLGIPGVACSTGSLGHGLPMAVGMALADRERRVYVVISDGELHEGSTWEAIRLAGQWKLATLRVFVDCNGMQTLSDWSETAGVIISRAHTFDWKSWCVDGHGDASLAHDFGDDKPTLVVCRTVKGKGVSYMERQAGWHYRSPNADECRLAMEELA